MAAEPGRSGQKGPQAFRTISETATAVGAPQHVLRFWETKFGFIQPLKRAGGRRFYRPNDIVVLKAVRRLLHEEGMTIKGVQRLHKDQGLARIVAYGDPEADFVLGSSSAADQDAQSGAVAFGQHVSAGQTAALQAVLAELDAARARLDAVLIA